MKSLKLLLIVILLIPIVHLYNAAYTWNLLPSRSYTSEDFDLTEYISPIDADSDGIDDAHDILYGAREFIQSGLKYKSKYYADGYPDDEYSVCTDVIWFALQKAGYSLKDLIDEDIANNIQFYSIEKPDSNIDFRRVKNLKVFFERHSESLTLDLNEIDQWMPGDIVTFSPSHIGIISDQRNSDGIPYLIHHGGQPNKEEDCLIKRNMVITGHFRWK